MRNSDRPDEPRPELADTPKSGLREFFSSYYRSTVSGRIRDSMTIGTVSEPESRFHYNACENAIIRVLAKRIPVAGQTPAVWRFAQERRAWRVLDVGSGTGHWVDFFLDVYLAQAVTAVEFVPQMAAFLRAKYADLPQVTVLAADIVEEQLPERAFDIVSAIGVLFHIVDDAGWRRAVRRLFEALKPGGLLLVGGDFGAETRDVQHHRIDRFESWREHDSSEVPPNRVNKRVRSQAEWTMLVAELGAQVVELVRSDSSPAIRTPENDLLVLERPA
jgi:SAM-dependent methyltransferase